MHEVARLLTEHARLPSNIQHNLPLLQTNNKSTTTKDSVLKYNKIRKQIKKLNDKASREENLMNFKKADELRNQAYFLSQVLENKSRGF